MVGRIGEIKVNWTGMLHGRGSVGHWTLGIENNTFGFSGPGAFHPFSQAVQMGFERQDCKAFTTQKSGGIQFGAPAEIIKDLMKAGSGVPDTLVLSADFLKNGEIMNEVEFATYRNIFTPPFKKLRVVGTKEQLETFKAIMQESFFGPKKEDVAHLGDLEAAGYFEKELTNFRAGLIGFPLKAKIDPNRDPNKGLPTLDEFIDFVECNVGESVKLKDGKVIASGEEEFDTILSQTERGRWIVSEPSLETSAMIDTTLFVPAVKPPYEYAKQMLDAPDFGVTFLGTSSGFDPAKRTTSFVLWAGGKGILVDPLADPKGALHKYGIHEDQIPYIFLTHVHADHDAGVMRMVLNGNRVKLITSRVIYESLLRKGRAMGVDVSKYIDFIEVTPGQTFKGEAIGIPGLTLDIRSALHSIPTIRFVARYNSGTEEKSLFYSADTYYNPSDPQAKDLQKLHESGVLSQARLDDLLNFGWDAQSIIHESGMAPIHTPKAPLKAKAEQLGRPIYLVHTAKPKPEDEISNLPVAEEGQTLSIISRPYDSRMAIYDALRQNYLLRKLSLDLVGEMADKGRLRKYNQGETIIHEGSKGDSFYIVIKGVVNVKAGGDIVANLKDGSYFGEMALLSGKPRSASVLAATETTVLELPKSLLGKIKDEFPMIIQGMEKSASIIPAMSKVELLKGVPREALHEIIQSFVETKYPAGQDIVVEGETGDQFFVIRSGRADVIVRRNGGSMRVAELKDGDVFGEMALLENTPRTATVKAQTDVVVLVLKKEDFEKIAKNHPSFGFYLTQLAAKRKRDTGEFRAQN